MTGANFWLESEPLLLASRSAARRSLLEAAALPFEIGGAPVDEASIAATLLEAREAPDAIAVALAHAKAEAASRRHPGRIVLAADQTLDHAGTLLMKPADIDHARRQLRRLAGESHHLHAAAVLRRDDVVLWAGLDSARLTMRPLTEAFLDAYLEAMGMRVTQTVGGYMLEGLGIHLFAEIEGSHATILGLPLLPLLHALRDLGLIAS
ncbi:Maf family protein [Rhabdaerophilum calidifontis]|uniref:Maf family protein n=1 Tax=Rhabdaerophilum calidifontis TaxID=2604328 RepID=UPI00123BA36E|nr:Maf family protein [Rhabdaerophilum calidifontis]